MHALFSSTVFFIGLPWDSTRIIKGLVKVLCLIASCIAKLEYFSRPKFMLRTYQWQFKSHSDFPKL